MITKMNGPTIAGILGAVAGMVTTLVMVLVFLQAPLRDVKLDISNLADSVTQNSIQVAAIEVITDRIDRLESRLDVMKDKSGDLEVEVQKLRTQIEERKER